MSAVFNLSLTDPEMGLLWTALNTCQIKGQDAPHLTTLMGKVQYSAQHPVVLPDAAPAEEKAEEKAPEEAKKEEASAEKPKA